MSDGFFHVPLIVTPFVGIFRTDDGGVRISFTANGEHVEVTGAFADGVAVGALVTALAPRLQGPRRLYVSDAPTDGVVAFVLTPDEAERLRDRGWPLEDA